MENDPVVVVQALKGAVVDGAWKDGATYITVQSGLIKTICSHPPKGLSINYSADYVLPGFVDIHNHGVGGTSDILYAWSNPKYTLSRLPSMGVTTVLASLLPMDREAFKVCLEALLPIVNDTTLGAVCAGFHAEGPVIRDPGALPNHNLNPSLPEFEEIVAMCCGNLKIMTMSPSVEVHDGTNRLRHLLNRNVRVAMGHDKHATAEEISTMLKIAHEYEGLCDKFPRSTPFANLRSPTVELIGDNLHVDPLTISATLSARRPDDIAFITDNILHGEPGTRGCYCGRDLEVGADGRGVFLAGTSTLAGSSLSLWDCFRSLVLDQEQDIATACTMLSSTPAHIAQLKNIGSISVNFRADLLLCSCDLVLECTLVAGSLAFSHHSK
eukprot:gene1864-4961_t